MKTPERRRNGTKEKHNILDHEEFRQKKKKKPTANLNIFFYCLYLYKLDFLNNSKMIWVMTFIKVKCVKA
jgi:hypothetical protein